MDHDEFSQQFGQQTFSQNMGERKKGGTALIIVIVVVVSLIVFSVGAVTGFAIMTIMNNNPRSVAQDRNQTDNLNNEYKKIMKVYDKKILDIYRKASKEKICYNEDGSFSDDIDYEFYDNYGGDMISNDFLASYMRHRTCRLQYALHDIDGNGIPELLISAVENQLGNQIIAIYTYDGRKVVSLCRFKSYFSDESSEKFQNNYIYSVSKDGYILLTMGNEETSDNTTLYVENIDSKHNVLIDSDESVKDSEDFSNIIYHDTQGNDHYLESPEEVQATMKEIHPSVELEWKDIDGLKESESELYKFVGIYENDDYKFYFETNSPGDSGLCFFNLDYHDMDLGLQDYYYVDKVLGNKLTFSFSSSYDQYALVNQYLEMTLNDDDTITLKTIFESKDNSGVWDLGINDTQLNSLTEPITLKRVD